MYNLKVINKLTSTYEGQIIEHFREFFNELIKEDKIAIEDRKISIVKLKAHEDVEKLPNNPGFYVILTDYMLSYNKCKCKYKYDDNKYVQAIYRGEASHRKERITGHLFRDKYKGKDTNFMTVGSDNGINIDKKPYCNYSWYVLMCSMNESKQQVRICVEKAFDSVFEQPMYSNR